MTLPSGEELYRLIHIDGKTISELCVIFGRGRAVIKRAIEEYEQKREAEIKELLNVVHLGTPLALDGDAVVIGDVHLPCTDWEFAKLPALVAQKHLPKGRRRLIIGGDVFNMDVFSSYAAVTRSPGWREERDAGRALFKYYLDTFDEIDIIMGNHDRRMQKWAAGELDETDIFGMLIQNPRVVVSNYGWLTMVSPTGPWRITHAASYSVNAGTVGDVLAQKFQSNLISHHQHHLAQTWDKWGRYVVVDNGTLVDPTKLAYVALDDSKAPIMKQGFTLLKNGVPHLFGKSPFTDWSLWI